jgi:hypothetical protein
MLSETEEHSGAEEKNADFSSEITSRTVAIMNKCKDMKTYSGHGGRLVRILNLMIRWKWADSRSGCFTPRRDNCRHPFGKEQCGTQQVSNAMMA